VSRAIRWRNTKIEKMDDTVLTRRVGMAERNSHEEKIAA
jgi:hypothetical protein